MYLCPRELVVLLLFCQFREILCPFMRFCCVVTALSSELMN